MKILTVVQDLGIGGTQRVAQNVSLGMQARGHSVSVLAHRASGPRSITLAKHGVPVFDAEHDGLISALSAAAAWCPDVVHIHREGYANVKESQILETLKRKGTRVVETNVFARFDRGPGGRLIDAHCLLSKWCAHKWFSWGGKAALSKNAYVVPNAVDPEAFAPVSQATYQRVRRELSVPSDRFIFGRVGQPSSPKWSPTIFSALGKVLESGLDAGLILVGAPNEYHGFLERESDAVRERTQILPAVNGDHRLNELMGSFDAFLHASQIGESFGMVLCEALQAGLPIVTLSTPLKDNSQLEIVSHGRFGVVALQEKYLPAAMLSVVSDKKLRDNVRSNGAAYVSEQFGIQLVCERFERIYLGNEGEGLTREDYRDFVSEIANVGLGLPRSALDRIKFAAIHNPNIYSAYLEARRILAK